ncbi:MAG: translation initiation factor [Zavarzinella sp.]|nr:translation initiation factor [Zavarzinella sp.]
MPEPASSPCQAPPGYWDASEAEPSPRTGGPAATPNPEPPKQVLTAKVGRETAGRRGKGVTTVFGLPLSEAELLDLAAKLKQRCGAGGTVRNGRIEIQGDNRDRVIAELEKLGFKTKRAGG